MPSALAMAEHLLTLPPASRVQHGAHDAPDAPAPSSEHQRLATALHDHGRQERPDGITSRVSPKSASRTSRAGTTRTTVTKLPTLDSVK